MATRLLVGGHEITLPGTETGTAEVPEGELSFLGMALRQPFGLHFQSACKFVNQASGGKIERRVA